MNPIRLDNTSQRAAQNVTRATSVPVRWNWVTLDGPVAPKAVLIQPNPAVGGCLSWRGRS